MIASTSRSGKHDSLVLKHQIIPMLPSPDAFAFFLLPIKCRYSHRILCEPSDLFVDYYPTNLTWLIPCGNWNSPCEIPSLTLDDFCYHRQPPSTPCQYNLVMYIVLCLSLGKTYT